MSITGGEEFGASADSDIEVLADDVEEILGDAPEETDRRRRVTVFQALVALVTLAALAVALQSQRDRLGHAAGGLTHLGWGWVLLAVAAETASMGAFARMQRRLLRAGDLHMAVVSALAIAYAGNAISGSIPLAGSEMSVAFTYREFERRGADRATAAVALVVSGVISSVTLSVIIAVGALTSGNAIAAITGVAGTVLLVLASATAVLAWRNPRVEAAIERFVAAAIGLARRIIRRHGEDPAALVAGLREQIGRLHFTRQDWLVATFLGAANWLTDIACLALSVRAVGLHVPADRLILVWSAGSAVGSLGLTPGGIGVVEAALIAALTAAGLPSAGATTAVLLYRIISFWAKLPIGWLLYVVMRRRTPKSIA